MTYTLSSEALALFGTPERNEQAKAEAAHEAAEARRARRQGNDTGDMPKPSMGSRRAMTRQGREKVFGLGPCRPMDRNAKARITHLARALMRRTEQGRAYGVITAKAFAVLQALLWSFHNAKSGLCFPSYERIAAAAGCARSTVYEAISALESSGLLTWCNRLKRVREWAPGLPAIGATRVRVIRTSNGYRFSDPSKSDLRTGTDTQDISSTSLRPLEAHQEAFGMLSARIGPLFLTPKATPGF
jgi:hypothetical protein